MFYLSYEVLFVLFFFLKKLSHALFVLFMYTIWVKIILAYLFMFLFDWNLELELKLEKNFLPLLALSSENSNFATEFENAYT